MDHYLLVRILHSLPAILLLLGLLAHAFMLWKAGKAGDSAVLQRKLRVTNRYSVPAFAIFALSLPFTGYWMVNEAGWPLSLSWLLYSSILYGVMMIVGYLLALRLRDWAALAGQPAPVKLMRMILIHAALTLILLLAIFALMGAKPL